MTLLFLANAWGWIVAHWRIIAPVAAFILIALLAVVFSRSCGKTVKLDEVEIQRAQQAIATEDRKQMEEVLAKSDAREATIDANISNAKSETINAIHESREKWSKASDEEIRNELLRRMNQ